MRRFSRMPTPLRGLAAWRACRTSRPRRNASSISFSRGAVADGPLRLQARLDECHGTELPDSIRMGQRLTGMTATQHKLPDRAAPCSSSRSTGKQAPGSASCCRTPRRSWMRSLHQIDAYTEAINHDPAFTFIQTGSRSGQAEHRLVAHLRARAARTRTCPRFVVMISHGNGGSDRRSTTRLWGSGFLPSDYQGVQVPRRRRPGALPVESRRASTQEAAAACSTRSAS